MLCIARTFQQENEEDMFEVFYIQENEEEFSHNLTQLQQQLPGDGKKGRQWESEAERQEITLMHGNNGCEANNVKEGQKFKSGDSWTLSVPEGKIDNLLQMIEYRKIQNSQPQ